MNVSLTIIYHLCKYFKETFFIKNFTTPEDRWFGLDTSSVKIEKVPLVIRPVENVPLIRIK